MVRFVFKGTPQPKQSARFYVAKALGKNVVRAYKETKVKDAEKSIKKQVIEQTPKGFVPYDEPIYTKVLFVFAPPMSFSKKKLKAMQDGDIFHKETKPDLIDNLMKATFDAMNKQVYFDDGRICKVRTDKIYGITPMTIVEIGKLSEYNGEEPLELIKTVTF